MSKLKKIFNTLGSILEKGFLVRYSILRKTILISILFVVFFVSPGNSFFKDIFGVNSISIAFAEGDGGGDGGGGGGGGGGDGGGGGSDTTTTWTLNITTNPTISVSTSNISGTAVSFTKPTASVLFYGIYPYAYPEVTCSKDSGSVFPVGNTTVTCSTTDYYYSGQTVSTSFVVSVGFYDSTPPTITLLGSPSISIAQGSTYIDSGAIAYDDAEGNVTSKITITNTVNTSIPGTYTLIYSVKDNYGNVSAPVSRTVNVFDGTAPIITLVGSSSLTLQAGSSYIEYGATALDNVEGNITSRISKTGTVVSSVIGTYVLAYTVTDNAGNVATPVFRTVNVVDNQPPVITLTGSNPQTIQVGGTYTELGATVTDNYDTGLTPVINASAVNTAVVGTYTVSYNRTDSQGNVATPVFRTVNVVDNQAPVITLTGSNPQIIQAGSAYTELGATVTDNYDTGLTPVINASAVNTAVVGTYTVSYNKTDSHGNVATPVFRTVNIIPAPDAVAPVITIVGANPETITVGTTTYQDQGATAFDAFDGTSTVVTATSSVNVNATGTYQVIYTSTDLTGNVATATRTVTVVTGGGITDVIPPVITITGSNPINIFVGGIYTELGAIATDNIDVPFAATATGTINTSTLGTYFITYSAVDTAGNIAIPVTRRVNVVTSTTSDTIPPVITILGNNPATTTLGLPYIDAGATAFDAVDGTTTIFSTISNVNSNATGTYQFTYITQDAAGNIASSTRIVTVVEPIPDITAPVITILGNNPAIAIIGTGYIDAGAVAFDSIDGTTTVTILSTNVNSNATGTYQIIYTTHDIAGNIATSTRTVKIIPTPIPDMTPPVITLHGGSVVQVLFGGTYTELGANAFDNVDGTTTVTTSGTVNTNATGTYTVTYSSTDNASNTASITRTVNVVDTLTPDTLPPIITINGSSILTIFVGGTYIELGATALDITDGTFAATATGTVTTSTPGTYTITYNAKDIAGNAATPVTRTINVIVDTTAPVITILGNNPETITIGSPYVDAGATAIDAVDGTRPVVTTGTVNTGTIGTYTITYTSTDITGNSATVTRTVHVEPIADTIPPTITLNGGSLVQILFGGSYTELGATAFDLTDGTTSVSITGSVDTSATGTNQITYTSTDLAGNVATVVRTVNVVDTITPDNLPPVITINGSSTIDIFIGGVYTELGATALDITDGTFAAVPTGSVDTSNLGTYTITYNATDVSGNVATPVTRTVNVIAVPLDAVAPVITIVGANPETITVGTTTYQDQGATAFDAFDGTSTVVTATSSVNVNATGTYQVIYTSTDLTGNVATATRTVTVVDSVNPITIINSTLNGIYYSAYYPTLAQAFLLGIDGTSTIINSTTTSPVNLSNVNLSDVTVSSSTLSSINATSSVFTNVDLTNCTIVNSFVKNYTASNCTLHDSIVDPLTGLNDITGTTATNSQIYNSDVLYSNVAGTYISTSTVNNSNITNATSTNSTIGTSTIDSSIITTSNVATSTITNSNVDNSIFDNSSSTNSSVTNSTSTDSTISSGSTVATSTLTSSDIASSTLTVSNIASSTITNSNIETSQLTNSTTTDSTLTNSSSTDSTFTATSISSSTISNIISSSSTITDSVINNSSLTQTILTNTNISSSTIQNVELVGGSVTDNIIATGTTMYINGTTTPFTATTSILITNIVNYNPIASFTVSAINDLLVTFTDTSSDPNSGTPLSDEWDYTWDFGDGTTLTAKKATLGGTITHTYSTANTYPVTLTVTDRAANTSKSEVSNINVTVPIVNTGGFSYGGGGSYWATPVPMIAGVSTSTLTTIQTTKPSTPSTNKEVSVKHEFIYNLSIGSRGNDITALQKILKYYGYYTFTTTTGYFGPVTKEAVIEYQKDNNITPYSGIVGPKTRVALNTLQGITVSTETAMYPEIVVIKNNQTISKEINKQAKTLTSVPTVTIPAKKEANFFKKLINYIKSTYSNLENAAPVTQ